MSADAKRDLDVLLRAFVANPDQPDQRYVLTVTEAKVVIAAFDRLRFLESVAGAVSQGESFADLKRQARQQPE